MKILLIIICFCTSCAVSTEAYNRNKLDLFVVSCNSENIQCIDRMGKHIELKNTDNLYIRKGTQLILEEKYTY